MDKRYWSNHVQPRIVTRRNFLWEIGSGFGGMALAALMQKNANAKAKVSPLSPKVPYFDAKAKRVIHIFLSGGMSQVDTFDYKPELIKRHGKPFDNSGELEFFAAKPGNVQKSYWEFKQHGESGKWVTDLLPHLAQQVDDMAFIHSMVSKSAVHSPAMFMQNSGFTMPGFPTMGSWVTYGLGTENEDLPAFVVIPDPRGVPPGGPDNWGAGFLPAVYQATHIKSKKDADAIENLFPPDGYGYEGDIEDESRLFLQALNGIHAEERPGDTSLEARISAYEMAARLQLSAPEATDIDGESQSVKKLYGLDKPETERFARQCILARRLVERGVRFVQIWNGADNGSPPRINWDGHEDMERNHGNQAIGFDQPAAALLQDLKQRGLLDDTLVIFSTEFGRTPCSQGGGKGRDHNPSAFTCWMAGGGVKGGTVYGSSDEFGFEAAENPVYSYDLHATALHLLGMDHTKLTFYHNGIERRLTDVHGHVIHDLIA